MLALPFYWAKQLIRGMSTKICKYLKERPSRSGLRLRVCNALKYVWCLDGQRSDVKRALR
eukprot:2262369-Pleurochrysis_carterae.AAC.1